MPDASMNRRSCLAERFAGEGHRANGQKIYELEGQNSPAEDVYSCECGCTVVALEKDDDKPRKAAAWYSFRLHFTQRKRLGSASKAKNTALSHRSGMEDGHPAEESRSARTYLKTSPRCLIDLIHAGKWQ